MLHAILLAGLSCVLEYWASSSAMSAEHDYQRVRDRLSRPHRTVPDIVAAAMMALAISQLSSDNLWILLGLVAAYICSGAVPIATHNWKLRRLDHRN